MERQHNIQFLHQLGVHYVAYSADTKRSIDIKKAFQSLGTLPRYFATVKIVMGVVGGGKLVGGTMQSFKQFVGKKSLSFVAKKEKSKTVVVSEDAAYYKHMFLELELPFPFDERFTGQCGVYIHDTGKITMALGFKNVLNSITSVKTASEYQTILQDLSSFILHALTPLGVHFGGNIKIENIAMSGASQKGFKSLDTDIHSIAQDVSNRLQLYVYVQKAQKTTIQPRKIDRHQGVILEQYIEAPKREYIRKMDKKQVPSLLIYNDKAFDDQVKEYLVYTKKITDKKGHLVYIGTKEGAKMPQDFSTVVRSTVGVEYITATLTPTTRTLTFSIVRKQETPPNLGGWHRDELEFDERPNFGGGNHGNNDTLPSRIVDKTGAGFHKSESLRRRIKEQQEAERKARREKIIRLEKPDDVRLLGRISFFRSGYIGMQGFKNVVYAFQTYVGLDVILRDHIDFFKDTTSPKQSPKIMGRPGRKEKAGTCKTPPLKGSCAYLGGSKGYYIKPNKQGDPCCYVVPKTISQDFKKKLIEAYGSFDKIPKEYITQFKLVRPTTTSSPKNTLIPLTESKGKFKVNNVDCLRQSLKVIEKAASQRHIALKHSTGKPKLKSVLCEELKKTLRGPETPSPRINTNVTDEQLLDTFFGV